MVARAGGHAVKYFDSDFAAGEGALVKVEDALSVHDATGLGAWAAGSASFLPALGAVNIDFLTIVSDPDQRGQRFARQLEAGLAECGIEHLMIVWGGRGRGGRKRASARASA